MFLIVGLGNPGHTYEHTRHNVGFDALDTLASLNQLSITQKKFSALYCTGFIGGHKVCLLKPQTYMNLSGKSVSAASQFFHISPEQIIVIHDDLDLAFEQMKIKVGGGHGGHNGLRDIIKLLGTKDFLRVRLGIGRPVHGEVTHFVLSKFSQEEQTRSRDLIYRGAQALETIIADGVEHAQQVYHSKN